MMLVLLLMFFLVPLLLLVMLLVLLMTLTARGRRGRIIAVFVPFVAIHYDLIRLWHLPFG